jgi:N-acyl-D-amino-acid deacylase
MVRGQGSLRWEEAIQKMTGLPAAGLGLHDRGVLRPGAVGDVVVFSPEEIHDRATSDDGRRPPSGIKWVLVNGGVVVDNGLVVRMDQGEALCPLLKRRVM